MLSTQSNPALACSLRGIVTKKDRLILDAFDDPLVKNQRDDITGSIVRDYFTVSSQSFSQNGIEFESYLALRNYLQKNHGASD